MNKPELSIEQAVLEVKRKLKSMSKNELVRVALNLVMDNYVLKNKLEQKDTPNATTDTSPTTGA